VVPRHSAQQDFALAAVQQGPGQQGPSGQQEPLQQSAFAFVEDEQHSDLPSPHPSQQGEPG
jgi:hypothetical protein